MEGRGLSCASPQANPNGRLPLALVLPGEEMLHCHTVAWASKACRQRWMLAHSPAVSLGEGEGDSAGWAIPPGLTWSDGWLWQVPRGVPAAGRAGCHHLAANRIRAQGGTQGGRLTLAPCFSAWGRVSSLQGMWERNPSCREAGCYAAGEGEQPGFPWVLAAFCRRVGLWSYSTPSLSRNPSSKRFAGGCELNATPPWPPAHCWVQAMSQGAGEGSQGMQSCYGGDLHARSFLTREWWLEVAFIGGNALTEHRCWALLY